MRAPAGVALSQDGGNVRANSANELTGTWSRFALVGVLLALGALGLAVGSIAPAKSNLNFASSANGTAKPIAMDRRARAARLIRNNRRRPLTFEPNVGQTEARVRYLTRGPGYTLFLTEQDAVFEFAPPAPPLPRIPAMNPGARIAAPKPIAEGNTLRIGLENASRSPTIGAAERLRSVTNYIVGRDRAHWHTHVPNYARVTYRSVYPGIDLAYYGSAGALETDFTVAPGADPRAIRLHVEGADAITRDRNGDAVIRMRGCALHLRKPRVYQEKAGGRIELAASYRLIGGAAIGIDIGAYDHTLPLIIDPVIALSGFLGGSNEDTAQAIALDPNYFIFLAGRTNSQNFPPDTSGPNGHYQAFVSMFSPDGGTLFFTTFIGGSTADGANGLAVDSQDNSYLAGFTFSSDFPVTTGATFKGIEDAFVAKLDGSGVVTWATLLGGATGANAGVAATTLASALTISPACARNCTPYITGQTTTTDYPSNNAFQPSNGGSSDPFDAIVAELTSDGTATVYSSFLGGSGGEYGAAIAVDSGGNAYVTGLTDAAAGPNNLFPVTGGVIQSTFAGGSDGFAVKVNADGTKNYATFLGGTGFDIGLGIAVDTAGDAYVVGQTFSKIEWPPPLSSIGVAQEISEGYLLILNPTGTALVNNITAESFGNGAQGWDSVALDTAGDAFITGFTTARDYLTVNPVASVPAQFGELLEGTNGSVTLSALPQSAGSLAALAIDESPTLALRSTHIITSQSIIYAGASSGLWISTDAGTSFHESPDANASGTPILYHAIGLDQSALPANVWIGTQTGLFESTDAGQSFTESSLTSGSGGVPVYPVVVDNNSFPARIYSGFDGNESLELSTDDGTTWTTTGLPSPTGWYDLVTAPETSTDVFVATDHGVMSSTDGATTFAQTGVNWPVVWSLAVDPFASPYRLIAGDNVNGVVTSTDCFASFVFPLTVAGGQVVAVDVNPSSGNVHALQQIGDVGFIWKSTDAGVTFGLDADASASGLQGTIPAGTLGARDTSTGNGYASINLQADPVVVRLLRSTAGISVDFSSYFGGMNWDVGYGVATDPNGDAVWLAGGTFSTASDGFPVSSNTGGAGGIQSDNAGHENAFAAEVAFSSTPTGTVTAPPPGNVNGSPGQTVAAGTFTITNNYPVAERVQDIKITVADPAEFSSMTLNCAGSAPFSSTATPAAITDFIMPQVGGNSSVVIFPNQVYTCTLSATISNTPALHASAAGSGIALAGYSRPSRGSAGSAGWGGLLAIGAVLLFAAVLAMPKLAAARVAFALAALLVLTTTQTSCDPCPTCAAGPTPSATTTASRTATPTSTATRTATPTPTPSIVSDQQLQAIDAAVDALGTGVTFTPLNTGALDLGTVTVI
jgi:Beta-propeller repeat